MLVVDNRKTQLKLTEEDSKRAYAGHRFRAGTLHNILAHSQPHRTPANVAHVFETFIGRWRLEQTFTEMHAHPGLDTARGHCYRTAPGRRAIPDWHAHADHRSLGSPAQLMTLMNDSWSLKGETSITSLCQQLWPSRTTTDGAELSHYSTQYVSYITPYYSCFTTN